MESFPYYTLSSWDISTAVQGKRDPSCYRRISFFGDPGGIRTHDPPLRRRLLYPTELLSHILLFGRGSRTRTGDPLLPKQVRYQLRYAPQYLTIILQLLPFVKSFAEFPRGNFSAGRPVRSRQPESSASASSGPVFCISRILSDSFSVSACCKKKTPAFNGRLISSAGNSRTF